MKNYYLSIGCMFKNEEMIIEEWIEHNIYHGVDHFYLINDESNDNSISIIKPYIDKGYVTLFNNKEPRIGKPGRQSKSYRNHLTACLKETEWLALIDMDEYIYSPTEIDIKKIIKKYESYAQIEINWHWFGSNGQVNQPYSVVEGFTKRAETNYVNNHKGRHGTAGPKSIINTNFNLVKFEVHSHKMSGETINVSFSKKPPELIINHYSIMSEEYWKKYKMTRGMADEWRKPTDRNMEFFKGWDLNHVEDYTLYNQNKDLIKNLKEKNEKPYHGNQ